MGVRAPLRARVNVCVCSGLGVASVSCTPFACGSIHDHESVLPPMRRRFFNAGQFLQAHTPGMGWLHVANDVCLVWSYVLLRLVDGVPLAWAFVQALLALYRCATWLLHACSQRRAHAWRPRRQCSFPAHACACAWEWQEASFARHTPVRLACCCTYSTEPRGSRGHGTCANRRPTPDHGTTVYRPAFPRHAPRVAAHHSDGGIGNLEFVFLSAVVISLPLHNLLWFLKLAHDISTNSTTGQQLVRGPWPKLKRVPVASKHVGSWTGSYCIA